MAQKILLIDSDRAVREALGSLLVAEGFEVVLCGDLNSAARSAFSSPPDIAILDFNVRVTAENARDRIRALSHANFPILAITALSGQSKAILAAGAFLVMEKPLNMPALLQNLKFHTQGEDAGAPPGKNTETPGFSPCQSKT